jgi:trehalose 6-phosphate phosphatase
MKNILLGSNRQVIEKFARSNVLLAFDFDGTLAPIVAEPARARMRPATSRLLNDLATLYPCIVISGRARADVLGRLDGIPVHGVIGNHGVEPWQASEGLAEEVERWRPLLRKRLSGLPGVRIEDKTLSVAVHYRHSREKKKAQAAISEAVRALGDVRVIGGKQVVNVLPKTASDKGAALLEERERLACEKAIYAGDDDTDEDVFALGQPESLLTIRVGAMTGSMASYYVRSQAVVDELLRFLLEIRQRNSSSIRRSLAHRTSR